MPKSVGNQRALDVGRSTTESLQHVKCTAIRIAVAKRCSEKMIRSSSHDCPPSRLSVPQFIHASP